VIQESPAPAGLFFCLSLALRISGN